MKPTGELYFQLCIFRPVYKVTIPQASCHKSMKSNPRVTHRALETLTPACLSTFIPVVISTILTPVAPDLCSDSQKPPPLCFLSSGPFSLFTVLSGLYRAFLVPTQLILATLAPFLHSLPHALLLLSVSLTEVTFVSICLSFFPFFH